MQYMPPSLNICNYDKQNVNLISTCDLCDRIKWLILLGWCREGISPIKL